MTDNILDDQPKEPESYFAEFVGDGKKYRDQEALAKSKYEADKHITQVEAENKELRDRLASFSEQSKSQANLESLIDQLSKMQKTNNNQEKVENKPELDMDHIKSLLKEEVKGEFNAFEIANRERSNQEMVRSKLKEQFGDNYSSVVRERINDLGLSEERFNALAKEAPQFLLKTLDVIPQERYQAPPKSGAQLTPKGATKRTWSYYQDLKKNNPNLYRDPNTMAQMERDAIALGDAFSDGDYNRFEPKSFDSLVMR